MTTSVREPIDDAELERRLRTTLDTMIPRLVAPTSTDLDTGGVEVAHPTELEDQRRHRHRVGAMAMAGALVAAAVVGIVWVVTRDRAGPTVPAEQPTTTAPGTSLPVGATSLPALVLGAPPPGFAVSTHASGPSGKDFDLPAVLVGWSPTGDPTGPILPVVVSRDGIPIPDPAARRVDRDGVTGTISSDPTNQSTTAFLEVDGTKLVVRIPSVAINDDAIVELAAATAGDATHLDWSGDGPPPGFVELARQSRDAGLRGLTYRNDATGEGLVLAALTDVPVNGLSLGFDTTVTRRDIAGQPALLLQGPDLVAYWTDATGVTTALMAPGTDHVDLDTFLAAAASVRRATPEEEQALYGDGVTSIETIPADTGGGESATVHLDDPAGPAAPTVLAPDPAPSGFTFDVGGTTMQSGTPRLVLWNADLTQWARVTVRVAGGEVAANLCTAASIDTPGASRPGAQSDAVDEVVAQHPDGGVPAGRAQLSWCQEVGTTVSLEAEGIPASALGPLAASVTVTPSVATSVAFSPPAGFQYGVEPARRIASRVIARDGDRTIDVLTFTAPSAPLDELRVDIAPGNGGDVDINGRRGIDLGEMGVAFQWDDHTWVIAGGTGLTADERLAVARSLQPADPSIAPQVTDNCDAVSLCG